MACHVDAEQLPLCGLDAQANDRALAVGDRVVARKDLLDPEMHPGAVVAVHPAWFSVRFDDNDWADRARCLEGTTWKRA